MPLNLEPLLPDFRVARIEHALRVRYPGLPLTAQFLTYYQDAQEVDRGGVTVPVPAQAVFTILVPNPRHPEFDKMFTARTPFRSWRRENYDVRHDTETRLDPAYAIFARLVPEVVTWFTNMTELTPLPADWNRPTVVQ